MTKNFMSSAHPSSLILRSFVRFSGRRVSKGEGAAASACIDLECTGPSPFETRCSAALLRMRAWGLALCALFLACLVVPAFAQTTPDLTGRIVDAAHIIPADAQARIEPKLVDLEQKSGIQLVVATIPSLDGGDIETTANNLFRKWALGEKTKNNGVLFVVAPNEHRVRIEVGYGLEGTLTDAISKVIIANAITPRFKAGDFGGGIERGVDDIITVLTTDSADWQKRPDLRAVSTDNQTSDVIIALVVFGLIALLLFSASFRQIFFQILLSMAMSGGRGGGGGYSGGGSFGGGGGGFSGGGGSSGGGGASGSW